MAPEFDALAQGGGREVKMPFWKDLTATRQILSDAALAGGEQDRGGQGHRAHPERCAGVEREPPGEGGFGRRSDAGDCGPGGGYWARTDEGLVISCLKGIFAAASMAGNLLAIHSETVAGTTAATRLNGATFVDASVKLGDRGDRLTAVAMHSATEAALRSWT